MSWGGSRNHPPPTPVVTSIPIVTPRLTSAPAVLVTSTKPIHGTVIDPEQFLELWKTCYQQLHIEQSRELTIRRNVYVSIGVMIGIAMCYCGVVGMTVGLLMGMFIFGNPTEANRMANYVNSMKNLVVPIFRERLRSRLGNQPQ